MASSDVVASASVGISGGSEIGGSLMKMLVADDIKPGDDPSYELCKTIYLYHPLGAKMAETPVSLAQSQKRELAIQDAPEEVMQEFEREWEAIGASAHIHNLMRLSRIYGIGALVLGCKEVKSSDPLDMTKIWEQNLFINALDPLNTAGSLVLSQVPTSPDFNKPVHVVTSGETFHRSRYQVKMNEAPIYLAYTTSAFGFVGRSVYQRALFPLKSFIAGMIADDEIARKLAVYIAKQKAPGAIIDRVMEKIAFLKRQFVRLAHNKNVISIDVDEAIETLDMQNVDGAGTFARSNNLKNIATAADMPAVMLDNETFARGMAEGSEDAKALARYIDRIRIEMQPSYGWFDNIVQYRAWNSAFYERMQSRYPSAYGNKAYADAFSEWRRGFSAGWPSLLIEPDSERIKVEEVKLQAVIAFGQTLMGQLDPDNKARLFEWMCANVGTNKMMFEHELELDLDALREHQAEMYEQRRSALEEPASEATSEARKFGRFDSASTKRVTLSLPPIKAARGRRA